MCRWVRLALLYEKDQRVLVSTSFDSIGWHSNQSNFLMCRWVRLALMVLFEKDQRVSCSGSI